jgi:outer membrane protein OmpA-like peptidoglycan-associated protein
VRIAALKNLGFAPANDGWELKLGVKLLFESNVDTLSDEGRSAVAEVARTLGTIGIERIRVEGHTDNVGSAAYNAALSQRRAESVARHLVATGWRNDAIERTGFGADKPVADNATASGRAQNRRVVIAVQVE